MAAGSISLPQLALRLLRARPSAWPQAADPAATASAYDASAAARLRFAISLTRCSRRTALPPRARDSPACGPAGRMRPAPAALLPAAERCHRLFSCRATLQL
eukprot:scaffold3808_cov112-Isochrysis_galbana.AAC.26